MDKENKKNSKEKEVKVLTAKEIKTLTKPEFALKPELYYPVETFKKIGFSRASCPVCKNNYWRKSEKSSTCGDSACTGKYTFIGQGVGVGKKGKTFTYSDAWKSYEKAMTTARIPSSTISRYPVVARWRSDVDFCAAGIYCFQPYCMTGELDPPANPLIASQFCARFNDLDNIGVTGRHYSGFIMLGMQVFNKKDNYVFFKEEVVEFNYRWLTEFLEIDPEEITFIEDVWCGGGNLGPCIEYFVGGLELGNMVFIEYKTHHDGSREKLEVQVVDVGIGLERIPWLINGSPTSYNAVFKDSIEYFTSKINIDFNENIWNKFGPYSCLLDTDETDNIDNVWKKVAKACEVEENKLKESLSPVKDMYVILDHLRTLFVIIYDGSLPSNVGGGGNVRNILRRVLAILHKNNWWDKINKIEGLCELIEYHKKDLEKIYGEGHFKINESIRKVLENEIIKYDSTDKKQKLDLEKLIEKRKGNLTLDDWILAIQSWGISADRISEYSKKPIPGNLYHEITSRQEREVKPTEVILYDTNHLKSTNCLYFNDHKLTKFESNITAVFINKTKEKQGLRNIIILDQSCFYPTSGGQANDLGIIHILENNNKSNVLTFNVINVEKVGHCTLHILDKEIPKEIEESTFKNFTVKGEVDLARRKQLIAHHTGTHIMFSACRKILGPHVWQNGAKKTIDKAHLDITHFQSLTYEEELKIENEANRIVMDSISIKKYFMDKSEAEVNHGFSLYQGGVVPGNNLRIVQIEDTDVEACCGTHCDNTAEVGWIKLLKTERKSDGILRLEYVCFEKALHELNEEARILNDLSLMWKTDRDNIVKTGKRFFEEYKKNSNKIAKQENDILSYQIKLIENKSENVFYNISDHENIGYYMGNLNEVQAKVLKQAKKGVVYLAKGYIIGLFGNDKIFGENEIKKLCEVSKNEISNNIIKDVKLEKEQNTNLNNNTKDKSKDKAIKINKSVGKKKEVVDGILYFSLVSDININKAVNYLKDFGAIEI